MPIIDYPFHRLVAAASPRAMLPIRVTNPATNLSIRSWGLIDTGADDCAFPAQYASILGHNLLAGSQKEIGTGNGITIAYAHTCRIDIYKVEPNGTASDTEIVHVIEDTSLDFMPNLNCILLGTRNFLSKFILTINYPRKIFSARFP